MAKKKVGRPFQLGHPGGPGRPKIPHELFMMKSLTKDEAKVILNKFLFWPLSELQAYLKDTSNNVLEYYIAKLIYQGIADGDVGPLNFLFDRLLGKVVDKVEITRPIPTVIELLNGDRKIVLGSKEENIDIDKAKLQTEEKKDA